MAAAHTAAGGLPNDMPPCPDPSAHERSNTLSSAASTAALLAANPQRQGNGHTTNARGSPLGPDGKLSSRSAATSLKYAKATDLPSFPSRGGLDSNAANSAAMLAKDHKMKDLWQPEASLAGSKAAALAAKEGGKVDLWHPSSTDAGHSAATLAMRNKGLSPQIDRGHTEAGRNNSLLAATKSVNMGRQRAGSMPVSAPPRYPDANNSGRNALNAATVSHRASVRDSSDGWNSRANQAARIKNAHMDREFFVEDPQIQLQSDIDERRHQDALHASAASFAKAIYTVQKRGEVDPETSSLHDDQAGAQAAHRRGTSTTPQADIREQALQYIHLQDAAQKLAQERLAKVDKDMEHGRYREYYGYPSKAPRKSRMSMRSSGRKRASSEGQYSSDSEDETRARRIRAQMSQLSSGVDTIPDKQRQEDRARLLAAAEKRVHAQMHDMDEKLFMETGKPTQAMMEGWETKAREKAERDRAQRERTPGKTHIGGGKFMDDAEIQAIAAARLKPTLDELNDTAEKRRARDEELRVERDRQDTARMEEKMKDQNTKAEFKRIKEQDKATARREKDERKAAERREKDEERARKSEDKRKSREHKRDEVVIVPVNDEAAGTADETQDREVVAPTEREKPQEKTGRGMFDRIAGRLKKHGDERKQPQDVKPEDDSNKQDDDLTVVIGGVPTAPAHTTDEDRAVDATSSASAAPATESTATEEDFEDDHRRPIEPADTHGGTLLNYRDDRVPIAGGNPDIAIAPAITHDEREVSDDEDGREESNAGQATAATAGIAALGGMVAAGGLGAERRRKPSSEEHLEEQDEISSLSTSDDESDAGRPQLHTVASAEHTGDYTFASPTTGGLSVRPDLERHISTIQDSSASDADDESDDLDDSDDDEAYARRVQPSLPLSTSVSIPVQQAEEASPTHVDKPDDAPDTDRALVSDSVPASQSAVPAETPTTQPTGIEQAIDADRESTHLFPRDEQGNVVITKVDTQPQALEPHASGNAPAPAPAVKTGPRDVEQNNDIALQPEKEHKGLRGLFSKLKGRSKGDNKLHKEPPKESAQRSTTTVQPSSTTTEPKEDEVITPVTTTSAGREAAGQPSNIDSETPPAHIGIDGPTSDTTHNSGIDSNPRPASVSSFKRYDNEFRDLDDVSSSGADEDDYARGRGGKLVKRLGLAKGKGHTERIDTNMENSTGDAIERKQTTSTNEEQFEEARDHFDESLAPPPAFAGQAKSESPNRTTRFQEQL